MKKLVFGLFFLLSISLTSFIAAQPNADFSVNPTGGCTPLDVTFIDFSTGSPSIVQWIYDFGDGSKDTLTINGNTVHTYNFQTLYTVRLIVVDLNGDSDTTYQDVNVSLKPAVEINILNPQSSYCINETVVFEHDPSNVPNDSLIWDFGDGTRLKTQESSVQHTYKSNGNRTVQLFAYFGPCADTATVGVNIQGPEALFSMSSREGCVGDAVTFTLGATSGVDSYIWYPEGEGGIAIANVNPYEHTYTEWDEYTPVLVVNDASYSCELQDTTVEIFHVEAEIGYKFDEFCQGRNVYFQNLSVGNDINFWDLGNGQTSSEIDTIVSYDAGSYTVKLSIENAYGCADSTSDDFLINDLPQIEVGNDTLICQGESAILSASGGHTIFWGSGSEIEDPRSYVTTAEPEETTHYLPVVTDTITGCRSVQGADSLVVEVIEVEDYIFITDSLSKLTNDTVIIGRSVQFGFDSLSNYNYLWSPEQYLSCITCADPVIQPLQGGEYPYTLTVTDVFECATHDTTITIFLIEEYTFGVPNAFVPDSDDDEINEVKVNGWGIKDLVEFSVYDRNGRKVFSTTNLDEGWDGTSDGKELPSDTYTYYIKILQWNDVNADKRGVITLYR